MNLVVGGFQDFVLLSFSGGGIGGLERIATDFVLVSSSPSPSASLSSVTLMFQTLSGDLEADSPLWLYWCRNSLIPSSCVRKSAMYQSWDIFKDKVYLHACSCLLYHDFHTVLGIIWEFLFNFFSLWLSSSLQTYFANRTCSGNSFIVLEDTDWTPRHATGREVYISRHKNACGNANYLPNCIQYW